MCAFERSEKGMEFKMKVECKNKYKMDYSYLDKNLKLKIFEIKKYYAIIKM